MTFFTQDVTGVFDSGYNQLFPAARPLTAIIKPTAKLMDHPTERGASITDHRIFLPTEIEIQFLVGSEDYRSVYGEMKAAYEGNQLMVVQCRVDTFPDMAILEMPHDETPDRADAVTVILKLREVQFVQAQYEALPPRKVASDRDSDTKKRGEQDTSRRSSKLNDLFGGYVK